MVRHSTFRRSERGSAAAELALSLPLMLTLLFGGTEAGFYFYSEHKLVESVRDGARFASRQSFSDFPCGGTADANTVLDIQRVVRTGSVTGTVNRIPNITDAMITVSFVCTSQMETKPGTGSYVPVSGIYENAGQAQIITIDVNDVPYQSLFGFEYGFPAAGIHINAEQQTTLNGV